MVDHLTLGLALLFFAAIAGAVWRWEVASLAQPPAAPNPETFAQIAVTHADDGLLVMSMKGIILWANPAYCRLMGYSAEEVVGRNPLSFALPPDQTPTPEEIAQFDFRDLRHQGETLQLFENLRKDGTRFWNQISVSFHHVAHGMEYAVLVCRDVTENIKRETDLESKGRELAYLASHDALTGAANRTHLTETLKKALASSSEEEAHVGVLHIDLDNFKHINDRFGHQAGDAVLVAVTQRLKRSLRSDDTLSRVGGDEFVIVVEGLKSNADLLRIAHKLSNAVNGTVKWQTQSLPCQISIGAALSGDHAQTPDALLANSDFALYKVKRNGRGGVATYDARMHAVAATDAEQASQLELAILAGKITTQFRPCLQLKGGWVVSVQASPAWQTPKGSILAEDALWSVAERTGLREELENAIIRDAVIAQARLSAAGYADLKMRIHVSTPSLVAPEFPADLSETLARHGADPSKLKIDLPESIVHSLEREREMVVAALNRLADIGIGVSLDNFGRGHIGLSQLASLSIEGVRVHRRLTATLCDDPITEKIFSSLIAMGDQLNLKITAKGVCDSVVAERLAQLGCDLVQGPWVAEPMDEATLLDWLSQRMDCPSAAPQLSSGQMTA